MSRRDEFRENTKRRLADRVAWKCCYPGCNTTTIGPSHLNSVDVVNLGEAAHICAAAEGGPRFDPGMTSEARRSIDNGIWMCRHHARLIDSDYSNYSSATLKQWKIQAENKAYEALEIPNKQETVDPATLVQLGDHLVFYAKWVSAIENQWVFHIKDFVYGSAIDLKDYCASYHNGYYIVIESQGDGRIITAQPSWKIVDDDLYLETAIGPKTPRTNPHELGSDIALCDENGAPDIVLENGDLAVVHGIEAAKQLLSMVISTKPGDIFYDKEAGSFFHLYYKDHKNDEALLAKLFKLEVARLSSIGNASSTLHFINRVQDIRFTEFPDELSKLNADITIVWGNNEITTDKYWMFI